MARSIKHRALDPLKAKFPNVGLKVGEFRDMVTVVVPREHILPVCRFLRDDPTLWKKAILVLKSIPSAPSGRALNGWSAKLMTSWASSSSATPTCGES